jgi:hypothetical protein
VLLDSPRRPVNREVHDLTDGKRSYPSDLTELIIGLAAAFVTMAYSALE